MKDSMELSRFDIAMNALQWVLSQRLRVSRWWNNVELIEHEDSIEIRWCESKNPDQEGMNTFESKRIPHHQRSLDAEIKRQCRKLLEDG